MDETVLVMFVRALIEVSFVTTEVGVQETQNHES